MDVKRVRVHTTDTTPDKDTVIDLNNLATFYPNILTRVKWIAFDPNELIITMAEPVTVENKNGYVIYIGKKED